MKQAWRKKLDGLKGSMDAAREAVKELGGSDIPDGRYEARITGCELQESRGSKRLQIMYEYTITEGEFEGTRVRAYDGLENEQNLTWVLRAFATLGYDIEQFDLDDLETVIESIAADGAAVLIRVRTKGEFQNINVDSLLETDDDAEPEDDEPEEEEKPKPKGKAKAKPVPEPEPEEEDEDEDEEGEEKPKPKGKRGKKAPEPEPEPEPEEEDDSDDVPDVGSKVVFQKSGKLVIGVVTECLDDDEDNPTFKVKRDDNGKVTKVKADDLNLYDDTDGEDEDEEEDDD
jgi:hypothetical protein